WAQALARIVCRAHRVRVAIRRFRDRVAPAPPAEPRCAVRGRKRGSSIAPPARVAFAPARACRATAVQWNRTKTRTSCLPRAGRRGSGRRSEPERSRKRYIETWAAPPSLFVVPSVAQFRDGRQERDG